MIIYTTPTCRCDDDYELIIDNNSSVVSINGVSLNGIPLTDIEFPITSEGGQRVADIIGGSLEIGVDLVGPEFGTQCIQVTGSNHVTQCQQYNGPGSYIFSGILSLLHIALMLQIIGDSCLC